MVVKNIRHSGIVVNNEDLALRFYRDFLGLKIVKKETLKGDYIETLLGFFRLTYIKLAILKTGDLLELYVIPSMKNKYDALNHIAFTLEDLDRFYQRYKDKIHFLSEPVLDPNKTHKVAFCEDYDGNLIELVEEL